MVDNIEVDGKTQVRCESQILAVGPELLPGLEPGPYPDAPWEPWEQLEITEGMEESISIARWLGNEQSELISSKYYVLPGQVFACAVKDDNPVLTCGGWVSSSFMVSQYQETAYEIGGKLSIPIEGLKFDFSTKTKDHQKESQASTLSTANYAHWNSQATNIWSSVLVRRDVYKISGRATICYSEFKFTCRDADVVAWQSLEFIMTGTIASWEHTFDNYRLAMGATLEGTSFDPAAEPSFEEFLTTTFIKGTTRHFLSPSTPRLQVRWTDTYSVMHKRDSSGRVSVTVESALEGGYERSKGSGEEVVGTSSAEIIYPDPERKLAITSSRCFSVRVVGGLNNTVLSGVVLREECP